jgi:methionyl-tRNA synthetase
MTASNRRLLVTAALPYANGEIHIGHLVEYLQTDIWCRYQRMRGNHCVYVCADDAHGTPIMLRAQKEGIAPKELVDGMYKRHVADFRDFQIQFDRELATLIYKRLRDGGHISKRTIEQAFDASAKMFLPDRFIKGTCPRCKTPDQYGDSCEQCGATYAPTELIDAVSVVSGEKPELRESEHYFFQLGHFENMLQEWTSGKSLQPEVRNKLKEWFDSGLRDWDISRDAPYWGFEIPDAPDKYFYVWLDAPVGYMASHKKLCDESEHNFEEYWGPDSTAEIYHFIGKDIAYFHTLFWPAMLHGAGFRTPTAVFCHGFLTVDGTKMSKSRGTFISARTYLEHLDPAYFRYYVAAKLSSGVDDIDLNLSDFVQRVNSDLVGKLVNIASRCAGILAKHFDSELSADLAAPELYKTFTDAAPEIGEFYEGREYARVIRKVMSLADQANQYIDGHKPWGLVKDEATKEDARAVCTQGVNLYRVLMTYLAPVLPEMALASAQLFDETELSWERLESPYVGRRLAEFKPLIQRVDAKKVDAMVEASKEAPAPAKASKKSKKKSDDEPASEIDIKDFNKIDLRVGRIDSAELVEGADRLLRLTVDLAEERPRTIFAGIRSAYSDPQDLVGRHVVVVANLKARKMKFGLSEGMVLAAGPGGKDLFVLSPDAGASPGMVVK